MLKTVLGILITIFSAACLLLGYRAWQQSQVSDLLKIQSPEGINEASFVSIGGIEQWISIRGESANNPVLLLIHGGPGSSLLPISYAALREWEEQYTIVHWDQRGSGRTFGRNGGAYGNPTLELLVADGIEVARWVRKHLGKAKITLVAHSMGSIIGIEMAKQSPELFHAYIGTGQIFDMQANEIVGFRELLDLVREKGDEKGELKLMKVGPPPYEGSSSILAARSVLRTHPPGSEAGINFRLIQSLIYYPHYSVLDIVSWIRAQQSSIEALLPEMMSYQLDAGHEFEIPIIVIQGEKDIQTPTSLITKAFEDIHAPDKELILIKGGGHSAILAMPEEFLRTLNMALKGLGLH